MLVAVFVPLRGIVVINNEFTEANDNNEKKVFVPLRGIVVINEEKRNVEKVLLTFSSPYGE